MPTPPRTSTSGFFEQKYRRSADPWNFATNASELARYDAILEALSPEHLGPDPVRHALEPGCSVGVLTARLAARCDQVDALEFAPTALASARERCAGLPNVQLSEESLRPGMPWSRYDLLVFSEVGYYFSAQRWLDLVADISQGATPGTHWLLSHWLGHSPDHQISGDAVHAAAEVHPAWRLTFSRRYPTFRISLLVRLP